MMQQKDMTRRDERETLTKVFPNEEHKHEVKE